MIESRRLQLLEWDSAFFGRRIARVDGTRLTDADAAAIIASCRDAAVDCLYLLGDAADDVTIRAAERHGFKLVDVRVQLRMAIHAVQQPQGAGAVVRLASAADLPALIAIARVSHNATRFHTDERFDRQRVADLYALWIERSVAGERAQAVWVVEVDGVPAGYVTLQASPDGAQIGLIAVDGRHRSRGLGTALLAACRRWCVAEGHALLTVVTQGRAADALRFYERHGFTTQSVHFWYHRWLTEPGN